MIHIVSKYVQNVHFTPLMIMFSAEMMLSHVLIYYPMQLAGRLPVHGIMSGADALQLSAAGVYCVHTDIWTFECSFNQTHILRLHIYIYIHTCINKYIYIYIHIDMYTYIYIYLFMYLYMYVYIYMYIYIIVNIYEYKYIHTYIHIYIYIYLYKYICIHIYTYIYICDYIHICLYTYIMTLVCRCVFMHFCMYIFVHACIHAHTKMRKRDRAQARERKKEIKGESTREGPGGLIGWGRKRAREREKDWKRERGKKRQTGRMRERCTHTRRASSHGTFVEEWTSGADALQLSAAGVYCVHTYIWTFACSFNHAHILRLYIVWSNKSNIN